MKKRRILLLTAICSVMVFSACSSNNMSGNQPLQSAAADKKSDVAAEKKQDNLKATAGKLIGLSIAGSDACYDAAANVFEENAKEMGWKVIRSYSDYKKDKEATNVDEFIAKKVDAVAIITADIKTGGEVAKRCNDANIPIFFMMTMPDLSNGGKATGIVTTDWYMTGFVNAEYIAKKYPEAKVAMIEGGYDQGMTELMRQGFLDGLKSVKNSKAKVVVNYTGNWMKPNAMAAMEEILNKKIDFDVIFSGNEEMMLGIVEVLKQKKLLGKYPLFAENGREDVGIKFLKEGIIEGTAGAPTTADGEIVFQLIKAHFEGKKHPYHINNPVKLLTKDNLQEAVPFINSKEFIVQKKSGKLLMDYTKSQVVEKEMPWTKEGNNYESATFYK